MQALALWDVGLKRWNEKRSGKSTPEKRPGVTVNCRDLVAVPVPGAKLLWRDLHVRDVLKVNGRQQTGNIRIEIIVEGISGDRRWTCGLEFDYANEESFLLPAFKALPEKGLRANAGSQGSWNGSGRLPSPHVRPCRYGDTA